MSFPGFGTFCTVVSEIVVTTLASDACSRGACSVTVTTCDVAPRVSCVSTVCVAPSDTSTVRTRLWKSLASIFSSYLPGDSSEKRYTPAVLACDSRVSFCERLLRWILAPGTIAPDWSVTVPTISPVVAFCAFARGLLPPSSAQRHTTATDTPIHRLKKFKLHLF